MEYARERDNNRLFEDDGSHKSKNLQRPLRKEWAASCAQIK